MSGRRHRIATVVVEPVEAVEQPHGEGLPVMEERAG
jgi:hypothetical protein